MNCCLGSTYVYKPTIAAAAETAHRILLGSGFVTAIMAKIE